ncbi:MAG TPA: GH25 family lysozyme [Bryobacteraceae bacterium]
MNTPITSSNNLLRGIDVSHFQQSVDWAAVASSGVTFCFVKASEGLSYVDPRFEAHWQAAGQAGLARGAYHFFHPAVPVTAQADLFLKVVMRLEPGDLPPVLDLEAPEEWAGVPVLNRAPLVLRWLQLVETGLRRRPMVYLSPAFMTDVLHNASALADYPVWLAHYTDGPAPVVPKPWSKWTFWQHSQTGTIPGIACSVDLNCFNGTLDELKTVGVIPAPGEKLA